jgi:hypothetical protein
MLSECLMRVKAQVLILLSNIILREGVNTNKTNQVLPEIAKKWQALIRIS